MAQFPHGIEWDEGQIAYVAIGIAAKSDEHLGILRQLTHVLGDEQAAAQLKGATDEETIINILTGATGAKEVQYLTLADFPADSLFEVYGSTELGVNCILRPEDQLRKPGSCGKPAPMVEVKLFDDNGDEAGSVD